MGDLALRETVGQHKALAALVAVTRDPGGPVSYLDRQFYLIVAGIIPHGAVTVRQMIQEFGDDENPDGFGYDGMHWTTGVDLIALYPPTEFWDALKALNSNLHESLWEFHWDGGFIDVSTLSDYIAEIRAHGDAGRDLATVLIRAATQARCEAWTADKGSYPGEVT